MSCPSRNMSPATPVWLDCDPGHDDAFAILLASYSPELKLLGISIVHGNDTVDHCALNAKRFLWTCGIKGIPVYSGLSRPIVRDAKFCPEIHGVPGEDGVSGMCGFQFPDHEIFSDPSNCPEIGHGVLKMVEVISNHPKKVTVVITGAQTNLAIALRMFPKIKDNIEKIVFMGGAIGLGNTGIAAEFNIEIDPEAAHVVFHAGIPLVMVPLEVTHSVLVTPTVLQTIAQIDAFTENSHREFQEFENVMPGPHVEYNEIFRRIEDNENKIKMENSMDGELDFKVPDCSTPFTKCCVQLLTFFKSTYKTVFSFDSPPLHDPCAIFYCINPQAFKTMNVFLDVELGGGKCVGRTLCDLHGLTKKNPNATVCYKIDVNQFWEKMFLCLKAANENSPLNKK